MKKLKLFTAFVLALMLCVSCTQEEPITPTTTDASSIHYRSDLFDSPCPSAQTKTCTNSIGETRTFQTPKCASRADFLAAINHQMPAGEIFQTFPMEDSQVGITYCQIKSRNKYPPTIRCREKCTDSRFTYNNTGIGDWTLYLRSDTEWKANSLVIYGLEYPYTYAIEPFMNHDEPLNDGWWFEVSIHPDDWDKVLDGILFSAER